MQHLPATLLPLITHYLPLNQKLTQLTHIGRSFPSLSPPCFRHDVLVVNQPLLEPLYRTKVVPPHIGAVDTLLFKCQGRQQLELVCCLLVVAASASSSSSLASSTSSFPPHAPPFSRRVTCLFVSLPQSTGVDSLLPSFIARLPDLLPLLCSLRLSSTNGTPLTCGTTGAFRPLSSLRHLKSLSLVNFDLTEDSFSQLSHLPLVQLDLHQSRLLITGRPLSPSHGQLFSKGGQGACTTLLMPQLTYLHWPFGWGGAHQQVRSNALTAALLRLSAPSASSTSSSASLCLGLERLCVSGGAGRAEGEVERWLALCPNLVVLDGHDVESVREGESEAIVRAMVDCSGRPALPRLQHCSLPSSSRGEEEEWSHGTMTACTAMLRAYNSQLLTLDMRCEVGVDVDDSELMAAVLQCGQLQSLTLGDLLMPSSDEPTCAPRLPHLHTLSLGRPLWDSDEAPEEAQLASILDHCPRLQSLTLQLHSMSPDALLWINQRCPDLRVLYIDSLFDFSSHVQDRQRWTFATAAPVSFRSLESLTITGLYSSSKPSGSTGSIVRHLMAVLRAAPRLELAQLTPQQLLEFAALPALRGLRLGSKNDRQMKHGLSLKRCWRQADSKPQGIAAQYSRAPHSKTSLWCSPHLRPDWLGCQSPVKAVGERFGSLSSIDSDGDDSLLRCAPPTDQEVEDDFWTWGEGACDLSVESVDGITGREALLAAFGTVPLSVGAKKRKRGT